ncbi:MAG: hypothetical protein OQK82_09340 [Candidatus Pacearchaeota archaeon]|nr:hypothetical protein [Candidatus Pacearchaeota archaeon]
MEVDTHKLVEKVGWIFKLLDCGYLLRNEEMNDHAKRVLLRIVFIQVDNLLKFSGRLKNRLFTEHAIDIITKRTLEELTSKLEASYNNSFDIVRDKLSAHNQPIEILSLLDWWNSIDYSTIEILYDDAKAIQQALSPVHGISFQSIKDYSQLSIPSSNILSINRNSPQVSSDRVALAKPNTVAMIACHESQEKAQIITSIIDFLEIDFALTVVSNNPSTVYERIAFDIGWMLAIIDLCSLIDNMFESNQHDRSLLDYWKDDMEGYDYLASINQNRDAQIEEKLRLIRNKFAAHMDVNETVQNLYRSFNNIDLSSIYLYACSLINAFLNACRMDIRTQTFLIRNTPVSGVIAVNKEVTPFDN